MAEAWRHKIAAVILLALVLPAATLVWTRTSTTGLQQAPDIDLPIIDGRRIGLHNLTGGPTLITFWATSCKICVKKVPALKALYQRLHPQGLELIAVAMAYDPPDRILAFAKINRLPYPIALDIDGKAAKVFNDVTLTPTTFLIAADGKIIFSKIGNINMANLEEKISTLLREQKHPAVTGAS